MGTVAVVTLALSEAAFFLRMLKNTGMLDRGPEPG